VPFIRQIKPTSRWFEYQRRARWLWIAFLGYVPGVAIVGFPLNALFDTLGLGTVCGVKGLPFYVVAGGWMVAFAVLSWRKIAFRCPRCGDSFFATWLFHNDFALHCVHCKLPKWEDP
jgi:ribosomal protein S27AE